MSTALVTGASSGIGAAIAVRLTGDGHDVVLVGRKREELEEVKTAVDAARPGLHRLIVADLSKDQDLQNVVAGVDKVDLLVHSAGLFGPKPFAEIAAEEFDELWRVNVRAPFLLTQALLDRFAPEAAIVFISSISGQVGMAQQAAYGATKAAIDGLVRTLAIELAPRGIRVNGVAPGFIATPMNAALRADRAEVALRESAILAGRLGTVAEIADAVGFLLSDAARFIYGISLRVDGGYPTAAIQRIAEAPGS